MEDMFGNTTSPGLTFVVWAPAFTLASGGILALHRLANNLSELGHRTYLWSPNKNPSWKGELLGPRASLLEIFDPIPYHVTKPIVIYPEIIIGNPLQAVYVVRWILNTPGTCGGDGVYGQRDLIVKWSDEYQIGPEYRSAGELTAWRNYDHFMDYKRTRMGTCYAVRKGFNKSQNQHPPEALCIDDYGQRGMDDYLIHTFNRRELFVCYDHHTMLPVLAALCGCPAVVIPPPNDMRTVGCPGVAWGFDDLPRAKATMTLTRAMVDGCIRKSDTQTAEFVELCYRQWPELKKPVGVS